jgi:hypothetical protein
MTSTRKLIFDQNGKAESKMPAIITIVFLVLVGFLGYKFVPVKYRNMKFKESIQKILNIDYAREYRDIARGGFNEYTIREKVKEEITRYNIPISEKDMEKQLLVEWPENKIFKVTVDYIEKISLPLYGDCFWKFHVYMEQDPHAGKTVEKD